MVLTTTNGGKKPGQTKRKSGARTTNAKKLCMWYCGLNVLLYMLFFVFNLLHFTVIIKWCLCWFMQS